MRLGSAGFLQGLGEVFAGKNVQQSVAVDVGEFATIEGEAGAAKAMDSQTNAWKFERLAFKKSNGLEAVAMPEGGPEKQQCIEELREAGESGKSVEMAYDEGEKGHAGFSARRRTCSMTRRWTARVMSRVHQSK